MPVTPSALNTENDLTLDGGEKGIPPTQTSISIRRVIRPMRGGSQARLVQCDDDQFYIAKFAGNPQGNRTLINELVSHRIMKHLGISTPNIQLLDLPPSPEQTESVFFHVGNRRVLPQPGPHLGSHCPANPEETAIFDFLPAKLLSRITNLDEFAMMFVLDKWLYNTDGRQAVYVRDRSVKGKVGYRAFFIDHGLTFSGQEWRFGDTPLRGVAFPRSVYSLLDMRALITAAVERIEAIPSEILQSAADGIPGTWLAPVDHGCLTQLLIALGTRRQGLGAMMARHLTALGL
jgi:hypothetical protein